MGNTISYYLESMQRLCPEIQDQQLVDFADSLQIKQLPAKATLFDLYAKHNQILFITKGLARAYYIDAKGEEKTAWFIKEDQHVTDYPAFLTNKASNYIFQTLENTTVVSLPKEAIHKAYQAYMPVQKYGCLIAEEILKVQQERIESFLFFSAKERYQLFLETNGDIVHRISVKHMASYLGIERQSLTRIRKQLLPSK